MLLCASVCAGLRVCIISWMLLSIVSAWMCVRVNVMADFVCERICIGGCELGGLWVGCVYESRMQIVWYFSMGHHQA